MRDSEFSVGQLTLGVLGINRFKRDKMDTNTRPFYVYVDVDDTFVRSVGTKRIPMPAVIKHIRDLKDQGAILYCWSSGGAEYAKQSAEEFSIADCFVGFLPKPNVLLDDQNMNEWRYLECVHPTECEGQTLKDYRGR